MPSKPKAALSIVAALLVVNASVYAYGRYVDAQLAASAQRVDVAKEQRDALEQLTSRLAQIDREQRRGNDVTTLLEDLRVTQRDFDSSLIEIAGGEGAYARVDSRSAARIRVELGSNWARFLGMLEPVLRSQDYVAAVYLWDAMDSAATDGLTMLRLMTGLIAELEKSAASRLEHLGHVQAAGTGLTAAGAVIVLLGVGYRLRRRNVVAEQIRNKTETIRYLTGLDNVTQLPNRGAFELEMEHALPLANSRDVGLAVLCIDLDDFKRIPIALGHDVGEELLKQIAERLWILLSTTPGAMHESFIAKTAPLARSGSSEFLVFVPDIAHGGTAVRLARRILNGLARPFEVEGQQVAAVASIGIARFPEHGTNTESLLRNASTAAYHAKRAGNNTYQLYDRALDEALTRQLMVTNELQGALERGELYLAYQPQSELASDDLVGVEALLRWRNPRLGNVEPAEFVPVAEATGLIAPIDAWVLETACAQAKAWQCKGLPLTRIAVNMSAPEIKRSGLVKSVSKVLASTGLAPQHLELEITESLLLEDSEESLRTMQALRAVGVSFSIDDFGTGYSSLSYLRRFPVDSIKIDASFVREVTTNKNDATLVSGIVNLAHSLNLSVVAEGVETTAQRAFLKEHSCDVMQGFLLHPPLAPEQFETLLRQRIATTSRSELNIFWRGAA